MTSPERRVLVVGWDGATFALLQPLLDAGLLPNLADLQENGAWQELLSTIPPVTAPAWATFMTGQNPGRHGVFGFFRRDPSGYAYEDTAGFVDNRSIQSAALWEIASRAGRRVGIVNVPLTYPPQPVHGFLISGMLTPPSARQFTYPPDLAHRLDGYAIDLDGVRTEEGWSQAKPAEGERLIAEVGQLLQVRARHILHLMKNETWDLFVAVFVGTDRLFHSLWPHIAADGPAGPLRDQIVAYLQHLDTVLGQMRTLAGPGATTLVLSDHGFGPAPSQRLNLNEWLRQEGWLVLAPGSRRLADPGYWAVRLGLRRPAVRRWIERLLPRQQLRKLAYGDSSSKVIPADWSRTRAHAVQLYNQYCGIEINRSGYKEQGIVTDHEYEALRDRLLSQLIALRHPTTGQELVQQAWRREELYDGPHQDAAPDLVLELQADYAGLSPLGTGSLVTAFHSDRTGDHRREGIVLAAGPDILPGRLPTAPHLADVAPTILYLLGLPMSGDMAGHLIEAAIEPDHLATHPPRCGPVPAPTWRPEPDEAIPEKDTEEIRKRLRGLGYLG